MTNLTTAKLKHLLDEATPGPWEVGDTNSDVITDQNGDGVLWNADQAVGWSRRDEDVSLAALAPELAEEVIRLRAQPELPVLSSDCASIEVPTRRTLIMDDADCPTLYEDEDSILVGIVNGEVEFSLGIHDEISVILPADNARNLAAALLAAAQHAEAE